MDYAERIHPRTTLTYNLRFHCCGRRLDAPDHHFGPAAREHYWFIYLEAGEGTFTLNHRTFPLSAGMVYVCFPHVSMSYRASPGSVWTIRWVSLDGDMLEKLLPAMGITLESPVTRPTDLTRLRDCYAALYEITETEALHGRMRCMELVYALLGALSADTREPRTRMDYIDKALHYMEYNYDKELTIDELAAYVNLDRGYFSKLFRARTGLSPKKWLTAYRMEKAVRLLTETELTIGEIALSVGYADPLYFSRLFHKTCGLCPSEYAARRES